jgi:tRNA 2-thiouridine synthesizing protein A
MTSVDDIAFDSAVDARGLNCPLPILKAKKALATIESGQVLKVTSTDPGSRRDFEAFARQTGNQLIAQFEADKTWTFFLKRR